MELETNAVCRDLDLQPTAFSTLKDGFSRFQSKYFKQLYETLVEWANLSKVAFIEELGICQVIDGSLFPMLLSITWTNYREKKNAFKVHLSFELNRMMATEFWVGSGNSSERAFLEKVVTAGVTYIAD